MFHKPLSQIEYSDVQDFCALFGEGVRVEYKSEMIDKIPKAVSAFANTLGGIIIIGVTTDKTKNAVTSIDGIERIEGVEERILSSCLDGIYPAVIPEIRVIQIPKKNKILVIIKIHESKEAPHSIENGTRVYIRTGSVSNPYDLSEIDRIEYLLKRRDGLEDLKIKLIQSSTQRVLRFASGEKSKEPQIVITVVPLYPYRPLISLDKLYEFCNTMNSMSSMHYSLSQPQRIMDGVCKNYSRTYREINHFGLISGIVKCCGLEF